MEYKELTVNGIEIKVFKDGSVEKPARYSGKTHTFGSNSHAYKRIRVGDKLFHVHCLVAMAFLSDYSENLKVDHIDGNGTNNSVSNLRMLTHQENCKAHRKNNKSSSSKHRGVSWRSGRNKWQVICNQVYIGLFENEKEAAKAWNTVAIAEGFLPEALNQI